MNTPCNDFLNLCRRRFSCRDYSERVPAAADMEYIAECARLAPSACNRQPWRFLTIEPGDEKGRRAVAEAYNRSWIATAPIYIVVCGLPAEAWTRPDDGKNHLDVDLAIVAEHICLAAADRGLGTCWICNFNPAKLTVELELPCGTVPMAIIPIGYPASDSIPEKKRRDYGELLVK